MTDTSGLFMRLSSLLQKLKNLVPAGLRPLSFCKRYLLKYTKQTVYSGPFKGMKYLDRTITGAYFAKILGTYEKELQGVIEELKEPAFNKIIVIGAGEGYYPIGFSRKLKAPIISYELNDEAAAAIEELASLNGTINLEFGGECLPDSLAEVSNSLILMDIEGDELTFLNSGIIEKLKNSFWIIEIHGSAVKDLFIDRLQNFFQIEFIPCKPRTMKDFPVHMNIIFKWLLSRYWLCLMQEWRGNDEESSIGWMVLRPLKKI